MRDKHDDMNQQDVDIPLSEEDLSMTPLFVVVLFGEALEGEGEAARTAGDDLGVS